MKEIIVKFHHDERGFVKTWDEVGELIRCKDCIWRYQSQNNDLHYCFETNIEVSDDDFCSRTERKEE
jgi:hypothetical protein